MPAAYQSPTLLIGGEFLSNGGRETLPIINPATEETIGEMPVASEADLDSTIEAASRGFEVWRTMSAHERSHILKRASDLIRQRAEDIATEMTLEQGKPLVEARAEVGMAADVVEWFAEEGKRAYGRVIPSRARGARGLVLRQPVGPVAAFSPWNFPALTPARKIAAALGAGCSCIIKPSEETPGAAAMVARAFVDAGLPAGALNVVLGLPARISEYLLASPVIRKLSFTGSTIVGKRLIKLAAETVKRTTMELGGHAPFIVFDDVDTRDIATLAVASKYRNAGQVCVSPTRFYVQENVYDRFVDEFTASAKAVVVGSGLDPASKMGPLANVRRIEAVGRFIDDAKRRGARLRTGGERVGNAGFYMQPSVLTDVPLDARVMTEEPFGPLAIIQPFHDFDDAISSANRLPYALAAYAFTSSAKRVVALGEGIEAGVVGINSVSIATSETPFGGMKESGYGSEGGAEGLDPYLTTKFVNEA